MTENFEGHVRIFRKIKQSKEWKKKRRFSAFEAMIYLMLNAENKKITREVGNQEIKLLPGELLTSQSKLAEIWQWNIATVNEYLKYKKSNGMIIYETFNKYTKIILLNWIIYNGRAAKKKEKSENLELQAYLHDIPKDDMKYLLNNDRFKTTPEEIALETLDHITSLRKQKREEYTDFKACFVNWLIRAQKFNSGKKSKKKELKYL